jgi:hypothetical protein
MKRFWSMILLVALLQSGCRVRAEGTDRMMAVREDILAANGCGFMAHITADLGEMTYSFSLDCTVDKNGDLHFTVIKPQSIQGITGSIDGQGGKLSFDDKVLAFPLVAQEQISPVSAPYLVYKSLEGGYIRACGEDNRGYRVSLDDSFGGENIRTELWLDSSDRLFYGEIIWQGNRVLTVEFANFKLM